MDYNLSKYEQETVINYNNGDKEATIFSCDPVVMRKLEKVHEKYPEHYKLIRKDDHCVTYECSKKLIRFGNPCLRKYTEEEKQVLRERLAKVNPNNTKKETTKEATKEETPKKDIKKSTTKKKETTKKSTSKKSATKKLTTKKETTKVTKNSKSKNS